MSDHKERCCTRCGSYLHHEDDCPKEAVSKLLAIKANAVPDGRTIYDCVQCGSSIYFNDKSDRTQVCNHCAQEIVAELLRTVHLRTEAEVRRAALEEAAEKCHRLGYPLAAEAIRALADDQEAHKYDVAMLRGLMRDGIITKADLQAVLDELP